MQFALIALALILLTAGALLQKLSASRASLRQGRPADVAALLRQPETWGATACLGAGALCWLAVLAVTEVSQAFPILALGTVAVVLVARVRLGERVSRRRWAGVALVVAGVWVVAIG